MASDPDPYRTLGLPRGATLDEVKAAYRRLAKANHPDAAGEAALPRFLAIQAAYEQLIGRRVIRGRRASSAPRRPWEAEPARGDATRRAYGGRGRGAAPPGGRGPAGPSGAAGSGPRTGTTSGPDAGTSGTSPGGRAETGEGWARRKGEAREPEPGATGGAGEPGRGPAAGAGQPGRGPTDRPGRRRAYEPRPGSGPAGEPGRTSRSRPPNKATFGSTSYDGADAGPFEPDWGGANWYGTTSGTYWTLNPKEYADPRKHGPEYQARARRNAGSRRASESAGEAATGPSPDTSETADPPADPAAASAAWAGESGADTTQRATGPARDARPTHTTTSWWDRTAGASGPAGLDDEADPAASGAGDDRGARPGDHGRCGRAGHVSTVGSIADPPPPDLGRAAADITRALTDDHFGGPRGRLVRAAIGWLPIAIGLGWLVGEVTGCGRFAATCDSGAIEPMLLVMQVAVFTMLLLVPIAASIATSAALTLLAAAVVASLILSATGTAADGDSRRAALGLVLLLAWLAGLAIAVVRRRRVLDSPTRPVS